MTKLNEPVPQRDVSFYFAALETRTSMLTLHECDELTFDWPEPVHEARKIGPAELERMAARKMFLGDMFFCGLANSSPDEISERLKIWRLSPGLVAQEKVDKGVVARILTSEKTLDLINQDTLSSLVTTTIKISPEGGEYCIMYFLPT
ncbi:hypothetical protein V5O48_011962 [Marasmius crinis-equi]|uniref:Uncharacterized protein n=1 Tax=Marasmius crinis-equi TaxID=585013 RepID=A0ABR3F439_9AGAR